MFPNSNDDLNNLVGKMHTGNKAQGVPPHVPPPPVMGTGTVYGNVQPVTQQNNGLRNFCCCIGAFIIITTVAPFMFMGWIFSDTSRITKFAMDMSTQISDAMPESKNSIAVAGDVTAFDPIVGLDQAMDFAGGDVKLVSLESKFVKSDGTMDLTASYHARTDYDFVSELAEPPADAPPVGAGGSLSDKWYMPVSVSVFDPGQMRHVTSMGGNYSYSGSYVHKGMERTFDKPVSKLNDPIVDLPTCMFDDLWLTAIEKGAPKNAVATIKYDENGYEFTISDAKIYLEFDKTCQVNEGKSKFGVPEPMKAEEAVDPNDFMKPAVPEPPKIPIPPMS